ncbi:MAG: cytochrome c maturation protein CcmE [Archaeoglobales archaeon]|nr:MAG: cytochrome c maturation protein CcmE [Archaeoglobales archaeon]
MEKLKVALGILIIIFAIAMAFSFKSGLSPYVTVSYVLEKGEVRNVQVNGTIVPNSTVYLENNTRIFELTDGKAKMKVIYTGILSNYQEGIPAVVVGDYYDGYFHAKKVLLKCPSKYAAMEENYSGKVAGKVK